MKQVIPFLLTLVFIQSTDAQQHLGLFEAGDEAHFAIVAADPETGAPTTPVNLSYSILFNGSEIAEGAMSELRQGVATGVFATTGQAAGAYIILISGEIAGVTAYTHKNFTLLPESKSIADIADETAGLNGLTPLDDAAYQPYYAYTITALSERIDAATQMIEASATHSEISARELSRARLWHAQNTIDGPLRKVPADMPSHMEIQLASPEDIGFATPYETFYRIFYYPDSLNSTLSSRETRSSTPPVDGVFYLAPDIDWEEE